ncbi:LysR substrate-binding domain-containing protein [Parasutterella excrementihominis]
MMPTPKMDSLIGEIQSILMRIDRLPSPKVFSPKELTQDFRIGCIDNAVLRFIVPSLANLYAQAPNIRLSIISLHEHFQWALEKGNIDIVIYAPPNLKLRELGKKFHYETLYNTDHVYVVRNTHPLAVKLREGKQLKRSELKNYRFIAVKYGYSEGKITTESSGFEEGSNIAIDTPYLLTVPHMLTQCDLIGRLPESSVKELIGNLPLTILPKNMVADPAWTPVFLWHDRTHFDPAHQWFRSVLLRSLEEKRAKKRQESKKKS